MTMKTRSVTALAALALGVVMAIPLGAQTPALRAYIPFEFSFAGRTMPAGEYTFQAEAGTVALRVRSVDGGTGVAGLAVHPATYDAPRTGEARLTFNRYGNICFLSSVVNGYNGVRIELPAGVNERELARTASAQKIQVVATTAGL